MVVIELSLAVTLLFFFALFYSIFPAVVVATEWIDELQIEYKDISP